MHRKQKHSGLRQGTAVINLPSEQLRRWMLVLQCTGRLYAEQACLQPANVCRGATHAAEQFVPGLMQSTALSSSLLSAALDDLIQYWWN